MSTLTLFFAGSGHSIQSADDAVVEAYCNCAGDAAFFAGPGGAGGEVCVSASLWDRVRSDNSLVKRLQGTFSQRNQGLFGRNKPVGVNRAPHNVIGLNWDKQGGSPSSATKRSATGKGWYRNVYYALEVLGLVRDEVRTINVVGHSRGSITVIMLLNDLFRNFDANPQFVVPKAAKTGGITKTTIRNLDDYLTMAVTCWSSNSLPELSANRGRDLIRWFRDEPNYWAQNLEGSREVNVWLYDPVGGDLQGGSDRHQKIPDHMVLHRIRVLRMENEGKVLSGETPDLDATTDASGVRPLASTGARDVRAKLANGTQTMNLLEAGDTERIVIPLCGSHGSGLSQNFEKKSGAPTSNFSCYVGTGLMLSFLYQCGTRFENNNEHLHRKFDPVRMFAAFSGLYELFGRKGPDSNRQWVNADHSANGYTSGFINAYHRYLATAQSSLAVPGDLRDFISPHWTQNQQMLTEKTEPSCFAPKARGKLT